VPIRLPKAWLVELRSVDSALVVRNYVMDDTIGMGGVRTKMAVQQLDCVISPPEDSGIMNHVELKISQIR
jgi:hypothetical protein